MTATEAIEHIRAAICDHRPGCFAQVSVQALELALAEIDSSTEGKQP